MRRLFTRRRLVTALLTLAALLPLWRDSPVSGQEPIVLKEALVIPPVGRYGPTALHTDAIEAEIVAGRWKAPQADDKVKLPGGAEPAWEKVTAGKDGAVNPKALRGGYLYWPVQADAERVMVLEASGHAMAYVNGEPRVGDFYQSGYVRLPVLLRKGTNDLLFHFIRRAASVSGTLRARLVPPKGEAYLDTADALIPDLLDNDRQRRAWAAVIVGNASPRTRDGLVVVAQLEGVGVAVATPVPPLPPLSTRKVRFALPVPDAFASPRGLRVTLAPAGKKDTLDTATFSVVTRRAGETYRRTFLSGIDGSVQYYAVNPARPLGEPNRRPALFLTLHGASVEAVGQANAYAGKTWGHLVAPTNRRPYGFDWEDWGRLDALEVLAHAQKELRPDPQRIYLTGHSMGGHGTWHLGATFPDRFAAIGPSAGWSDFWTYAGGKRPEPKTPVEELLHRTTNSSDTLLLARNYAQHGVYILHGEADVDVKVVHARAMKKVLEGFHRDFQYHEQPKAGHWWDLSPEPGVDCVDWAPMFDFFARRVIPRADEVREVRFVTACPGISAQSHWARIEAQVKAMQPSSVNLRFDPGRRRFAGTTENVARLALDLGHVRPGVLTVELDGQKLEKILEPTVETLWLQRQGEKWSVTARPLKALKGPHRYGPFRDVFRNRMRFVYGTKGTAAENAWARARARYDAETFWYRGNGSVDVIPDTAFDAAQDRDRNVILYGNADTNGAWGALLKGSPVQLQRGGVTIGERAEKGADLACLFLRPRPGSEVACVGVVGGSGVAGMRLTDRLPYFVSGVGYPDCIVLGPETLQEGSAGVRVAGFFGLDWGVPTGEFVWRQ